MRKRIFTLMLAVFMCLAFLPANIAFAAEKEVPVVAPVDSTTVKYAAFTPGTTLSYVSLGKSVKQGEEFTIPVIGNATKMIVDFGSNVKVYVSSDFASKDYMLVRLDATFSQSNYWLEGIITDDYESYGASGAKSIYAYVYPGAEAYATIWSSEFDAAGIKQAGHDFNLPNNKTWDKTAEKMPSEQGPGIDFKGMSFTVTRVKNYTKNQLPGSTSTSTAPTTSTPPTIQTKAPKGTTLMTITDNVSLNVRAKGSIKGDVVGSLEKGDQFYSARTRKGWGKVYDLSGNLLGYSYINPTYAGVVK